MATYRTIPNTEIDAESPGTEQTFVALRDNPTAIAEGASGAPRIAQGALKSTTSEQSASVGTGSSNLFSLTGGLYTLGYETRISAGGPYAAQIGTALVNTTYDTYMRLQNNDSVTRTLYVNTRYIQASPPYNHGPLFIYVIIDKNGNIESVSIAPDPPWANNGPTSIKPDYYDSGKGYKKIKKARKKNGKLILPIQYETLEQEITMDYKDSDMELIPHPFQGNDLTDKTIAIIEPGSDLCCELCELHETGESINDLFHDGYFVINNQPLKMNAPPECTPVSAKWKLTK